MNTKEIALAYPVIGKYVQKIYKVGYYTGGSSIARKFGSDLEDLRLVEGDNLLFNSDVATIYAHISFAVEDAIRYLLAYPDTAHMLDLPTSTLVAMARMGNKATVLYFPFGEPDDEYPRTEMEEADGKGTT